MPAAQHSPPGGLERRGDVERGQRSLRGRTSMAVRRRAVIAFAVLALGLLAPERAPARQRPPRKHSHLIGNRHFEAWWWVFAQRAYPLGYVPEGAKERALRQIENAKANPPTSPAAPSPSAAVAGDAWVNIGPAPINGGQVAATGNTRPMSRRVRGQRPSQVDRRGGTWALLAASTFAGDTFSDIKVHPTNPDIVLAAITFGRAGRGGAVFPPTVPPRGIFRSTDGGMSWSQRQAGDATDLEVDPTNFNNQYAGVG